MSKSTFTGFAEGELNKSHLNLCGLTGAADEFRHAIEGLVERVRTEGHPGVLSYRFYVSDTEHTARAIIDYETPDAWIGHHDVAMQWPEMKQLHAVATLSEVTFLGPLTQEIEDWIENSTLSARIVAGYRFAAGFRR